MQEDESVNSTEDLINKNSTIQTNLPFDRVVFNASPMQIIHQQINCAVDVRNIT